MASFTNEWRTIQDNVLDALERQDNVFREEMKKQRDFEEELLRKDREETAKTLKEVASMFLSRYPSQPQFLYPPFAVPQLSPFGNSSSDCNNSLHTPSSPFAASSPKETEKENNI